MKGVNITIASGCKNAPDFLMLPIITKGAVGALGIQFPASSLPVGEKHTKTDKDGHFKLAVKSERVYFFEAGRGNAYALVHVRGTEPVRFDPKMGKSFHAQWCFLPPPAWIVTVGIKKATCALPV